MRPLLLTGVLCACTPDPILPDPPPAAPAACTDPVDGIAFDRTVLPVEAPVEHRLKAGGFVAADLTGDGLLELLAPGVQTWTLWSLQADGSWADLSDRWLGDPPLRAVGGSAADFDADGDLDVVITADREPDRLFRNDGDRLVDVTEAAGMVTGSWRTMSASWADVDADGDLDLFLGGYGPTQPSSLWLGDGAGTFDDASAWLPPSAMEGWTFASAFHDLQGDGHPDLFVPNDFPGDAYAPSLVANHGTTPWTRDTDSGYHPGFAGMGITLVDLNDDGLPDPLETTFRAISYLRSRADPRAEQGVIYIDASAASGLGRAPVGQSFGWGLDAADLDHDGILELEVTFGHWDYDPNPNPAEQPDSLFAWRPDLERFERLLDHDLGPTRGLLFVDLDGDGWMDRVKRNLDGELIVDRRQCGDGGWLTVALRDPGSANRRGIGATVRVLTDPVQTRYVEAGSRSMFVGGPPQVHAGLGGLTHVDVEVVWPDGEVTRRDSVPASTPLVVTR